MKNKKNTYLNYWYDKRQLFSLDRYSDNKDPRVIEYKSWRGRFTSNETEFEKGILQNIRDTYNSELAKLTKDKAKHCETVSDLIKLFRNLPQGLLLDVFEVNHGIY